MSVTTKGISNIPSFTLGRPAAIFDLYVTRRRLSFEPEFRVGLDGKPWAFLFWWRYRLLGARRVRVQVGAHPAVSFRTVPAAADGSAGETLVARRYLTGELSATYALARGVGVGTYYLYAHGVEREGVVKHTNFAAARATLTRAGLPGRVTARLAPQLYYLPTDDRDGVYANSALSLARGGSPVSLAATVNRAIHTRVAGGRDVLWNVSLNYAFTAR